MKSRVYDVKTMEEALPLAVEELGLSKDRLEVTVLDEKKGFLGFGGKLQVEVKAKEDGIDQGKEYLQMIMQANKGEGFIEKRIRGNVVEFNIDAGELNGVLIGKNSKHLIALQTLVSMIINSHYNEDEQKIVKIDVGGYRKRRESTLERMAVDFGKQVAKTKQQIKLDNLNSYERKIIHDKLSTWKDVTTHSEGEEPDRYLIIEPKE
ncbi:MAG: Jag N-terminal domain-containing protein [Bacilli bacterium]|jgi:spoIIIJ-associated protein|nr:Jag N-terminal domain-containing protein [Bacilli bacterium]MDY0064186.1 RNA-binding cell elongation regulator Jag/EloR [Bacilli bacterium]